MGMRRSFDNEAIQNCYDFAKKNLVDHPEDAYKQILEALEIAVENEYWYLIHDFSDELISYAKFDFAYKLLNLAIQQKDIDDTLNAHIAMSYRKLAVVEYQQANYEDSFSNLYKAQAKCPPKEKYISLLIKNDFGIIYFYLNDYKHAEEQFKLCFDEGKTLLNINDIDYENKTLFINNILINLGSIYNRTNNYDKAKQLYLEALSKFNELKDYSGIANIYNNLGIIEASLGNYHMSKEYFEKSIEIKKNSKDMRSLARSYVNLGECNLLLKNYKETLEVTNRGLEMAKTSSYTQLIYTALEIITRTYEELKDYENAYHYLKEQKIANDEYNNKLHQQKLAELQVKHKTKEHEMDKELYKIKNEELANAIAVRDKLYSVIAHDLRGPINNVYSVLEMLLMTDETTPKEMSTLIDELYNDTKSTMFLLDNLLQWGKSSLQKDSFSIEKINLLPIIDSIVELNKSFIEKKDITLKNLVKKDLFLYGDKNVPSLVIRNILRNAIKFTPDKGNITITEKTEKDFIKISIRDNGIGMPQEAISKLFTLEQSKPTYGTNAEKGAGLGLYLSHDYLVKSGGKIEVKSEIGKGSEFTIYFPVNMESFLQSKQ